MLSQEEERVHHRYSEQLLSTWSWESEGWFLNSETKVSKETKECEVFIFYLISEEFINIPRDRKMSKLLFFKISLSVLLIYLLYFFLKKTQSV